MAFCTQCGSALPEDARFCAICGKAVTSDAAPAPAAAPVTMPCSAPIPEKDTPPTAPAQPVEAAAAAPAQDFTQPVIPNATDFTQPVNPYLDPTFAANNGALFESYGGTVPTKKKRRPGLIIALVALVLAMCVGLGFLLLDSLGDKDPVPADRPDYIGSVSGAENATDAEADAVFGAMLDAVVAEDPLAMFRTFYEFRDYTDAELQSYIDTDFDEYGYASDAAQVDDWFDIFVWRYCPVASTLHTGVDNAQMLSLFLEDTAPADGEYVTATATIVVDGADVDDEEMELTFSMSKDNGRWYVVNYDSSLAYDLMGDAAPIYDHCEYMFYNMFNYANSTNSTDLLYFFYDLYVDSYDNNILYMNDLLDTYGGSEADFSNRLINRFLYLSGYSKNGDVPDAVDFEVLSYTMEAIPSDYTEKTFLDAEAEVRVTYANGSSETAHINFEVTYYYGYWLVVLGEH